ncbi:MAG: hypothetical protein IJB86_07485, partial [Clostridia bacterium]|nr:hypothetical protein [Clostridia bacterium]
TIMRFKVNFIVNHVLGQSVNHVPLDKIAAPTFWVVRPQSRSGHSERSEESKIGFLSLSHGKTPKVAAQNIQTE